VAPSGGGLVPAAASPSGPRRVECGELLQAALDLGLQAALRHDPGEQRGDRRQELDLGLLERPPRQGLDVEHPDDLVLPHERHGQHRVEALDVETADPREARIDGDVADRDRGAGRCRASGDPLADGKTDPPDLRAVKPVRRGQRQPVRIAVGQVEGADLDAHGLGRAVDDGAHELVPVARLRREPRDLVEERQLVQPAPGG
jgi:hypothetical protein